MRSIILRQSRSEKLHTGLLALLFFFPLLTYAAGGNEQPPQTAQECPEHIEEFIAVFKKQIRSLKTPDYLDRMTGENQLVPLATSARECLLKLPSTQQARARQCMGNIERLASTFSDDSLGLNVARSAYPKQNPLTLPEPFFNDRLYAALTTNSSRADVNAQMAQLMAQLPPQAKALEFTGATTLPTYVVIVPSEKDDLYVHIINGLQATAVRRADVIRVNKLGSDGRRLIPPTTDFFAIHPNDTSTVVDARKCMACHRSSTIAILPNDLGRTVISHTKGMSGPEVLNWFEKMRTIEGFAPNANYDNLAPALGQKHVPTRTTDFVMSCAAPELPEITRGQADKIRSHMNCLHCHQMTDRDPILFYPMHSRDFSLHILDSNIVQGHMPPGAGDPASRNYLTTQERKALLRCLKAEYFGGFSDPNYSQGNTQAGVLMKYLTESCDPNVSDQLRKAADYIRADR
jgi:hypothetical protein